MESVASADEPHSHFTDLGDDVTICDAWAIRNALVNTYHIEIHKFWNNVYTMKWSQRLC